MSQRMWARAMRQRKESFRKPVPELKTWNIIKGDLVEIRGGRSKGKQGVVAQVLRKVNRIVVEGCNLRPRLISNTEEMRTERVVLPSPIHISNVGLVDPSTGRACRVKKAFLEDGTKIRVSRQSGNIIPRPPVPQPRRTDLRPMSKDTPAELVLKRTYVAPK